MVLNTSFNVKGQAIVNTLVLRLIARGKTVRAWPSTNYWRDIGRQDDYEMALDDFSRLRSQLLPTE